MSVKFEITAISIFPVKSLSGIFLDSASAGEWGLLHDRRWMVVDENMQFMTQRKHPSMGFLGVTIVPNGIEIFDKNNSGDRIAIAHHDQKEPVQVTVWNDTCEAERYISPEISGWLSKKTGVNCSLVYAPDTMKREVDTNFSPLAQHTGFADAFPYLLANTASLKDINKKTGRDFEMVRFRPNIVFEGDEPFQEDRWKLIKIGEVLFRLVKPCSRCVMITIDPKTGKKDAEPLKTLATYRKQDNKVLFAQNMIAENEGRIKTGDFLEVLEVRD